MPEVFHHVEVLQEVNPILSLPRFGGSSAFLMLSNKEKGTRAGLLCQCTVTESVMDDFGGNIPQCSSALISWRINTIAEHG
jgi:hypothetical protein